MALGGFLKTYEDGLCSLLISVSGLDFPLRTSGMFLDFGDTKSLRFFFGFKSSPMKSVGLNVSKFGFFVSLAF